MLWWGKGKEYFGLKVREALIPSKTSTVSDWATLESNARGLEGVSRSPVSQFSKNLQYPMSICWTVKPPYPPPPSALATLFCVCIVGNLTLMSGVDCSNMSSIQCFTPCRPLMNCMAWFQSYLHYGAPGTWLPYTSIDHLLLALRNSKGSNKVYIEVRTGLPSPGWEKKTNFSGTRLTLIFFFFLANLLGIFSFFAAVPKTRRGDLQIFWRSGEGVCWCG